MSLSRFTFKNSRLTTFTAHNILKTKHERKMSSRIYPDDQYTDSPNYPAILDLSPKPSYRRERDNKLNKIKKLGTVEEKFFGINMPRFYGWSSLMLKEGNFPFNFLPFIQHITRTDYIDVDQFPFSSNLSQTEIENLVKRIRPQLQDAILLEMVKKRPRHEVDGRAEAMGEGELADEATKGVVEQINRILSANLVQQAAHLYETEIDFEPRIEAFWRVGGFYPDQKTFEDRKKDKEDHEKDLKTNRYAKRKIQEEPEDLVGHFIQYLGQPILQLRSSRPLKPLETRLPLAHTSATEVTEGVTSSKPHLMPDLSRVPVLRYDPGFYGLEKIRRHGTNIPGFWPGDPNEFGLLSFHSRGHLLGRPPSFGTKDTTHTVTAQAILAGFSWLLGQATYQGFTTFQDLTYPLATSSVVTDGRVFSFFASQLNTLLFHDEHIDENPRVNVCYGTPTRELFQSIQGDEIIGWDDRVVQQLVEVYLNAPANREGVDLKPYLDKDAPYVKDIDHEERRVWLHEQFRYLSSNRPRHRLDPEIYDWENIYKIKFQTRPLDPRRRFFEVGVDPFKRRLDDRKNCYIPKKLRDPENPKKKLKDSFWPDC
uniref:28S ribosomal protein S30, mitochondrial n=1 Tax=Graphocephala atropunctata TaxID=36148 RepID=A0A1B6LLN1_9HEMI